MTVDQFPQAKCWTTVAGRSDPTLATGRWSSNTTRIRTGLICGSIHWVPLVSGRFSVPILLS